MDGTGRRRVFLMRHGHVDYFQPGLTDPRVVELTDEGRSQAAAAAQALAMQPFDFVACSGLPRTRQTAEIVLQGRDLEAEIQDLPGLEELKSGWLQADSREELAARLAFSFDDAASPGARFLPDGESFCDAEERITATLEAMVYERTWTRALVVAHEGVNRIILGWACGGGLATVPAFEQDLGCVNVIDFDIAPSPDGDQLEIVRAVLKAVNITPYDYVKDGLPKTSLEHLFDVDFGASRPARPEI